jgi:hypothetical protein
MLTCMMRVRRQAWYCGQWQRIWTFVDAEPDVTLYQRLAEGSGEISAKKMLKKYVRSRYVYENKQISDKMPGKNSDIYVYRSDIFV